MRYLNPDEVAQDERLPISTGDWVRAQLRRGTLRGSRVGGRWVVEVKEDPRDQSVTDAIDEMLANGSNQARRKKARRVA